MNKYPYCQYDIGLPQGKKKTKKKKKTNDNVLKKVSSPVLHKIARFATAIKFSNFTSRVSQTRRFGARVSAPRKIPARVSFSATVLHQLKLRS
jgi:hypothetical protein